MNLKEKMHDFEVINKDRFVKDIQFMLENDKPDAFLVMENNAIIGIVTDSDIILKVTEPNKQKIKDIMSSPVITIESNKSIEEAIDLMVLNNIEKLPIIENGKAIGIIYGEEILELDEEKWKEIIFNKTIEETYKIINANPNVDIETIQYKVTKMDSFKNIEQKVDFDLFVYQEGLILVAYNYITENKNKDLGNLKLEIKK